WNDGSTARKPPTKWYDVYRSSRTPVDTGNSSNLIAVLPGTRTEFGDTNPSPRALRLYYAVTALDSANVEPAPVEQSIVPAGVLAATRSLEYRDKLGDSYTVSNSFIYFPFELKQRSNVSLRIVDAQGTPVQILVDGVVEGGQHVASVKVGGIPH